MTSARFEAPAHRWLPLALSTVAAVAFVIVRPAVPDLQAALARAAAAAHGVGLTYWFQWFGGGATPAQYSILTPWLSSWISAPLLGAAATVAVTPLLRRALFDTPYRIAGTWVGTITAGASLWSGRIAFAVGMACAVVAVIGLKERRPLPAALGTIASVVTSPVSAAFLAIGLLGTALTERRWRRFAVICLGLCAAALLVLLAGFGSPGPEIYKPGSALLVSACCLLMLAARPARVVQVVAAMTALASPVLLLVPNGMGSNLTRMSSVCLPAAVLATAAVRRRWAVLAVAPAVAVCVAGTVHDLTVAAQPAADSSYYTALAQRLDHVPDLRAYRLEVVQSGSFHTASYALLDHAALATGWETQAQRQLDAVLTSKRLDAATYRTWLDDNAVGYLAFDHRSPDYATAEYRVVAHHLPYLTAVWHDSTWTLYRVAHPTPIVAAPAAMRTATQAALRFSVPCRCPVLVRVRWSDYLTVVDQDDDQAGTVVRSPGGWSEVTVPKPGVWVLRGRY